MGAISRVVDQLSIVFLTAGRGLGQAITQLSCQKRASRKDDGGGRRML